MWIVFWFLVIQFAVIALLAFEIKTRKKAELALATAAQNYRAIFEQSPLGVVEVALNGEWILANDKACEIVGDTRANRLGKTVEDLVLPEDWQTISQSRANLIKGDIASFSAETELTQKSGRKIWVRRTSSLIKDAELRPKVVMMMLEDITRRKEAEQQLLREQRRAPPLRVRRGPRFTGASAERSPRLRFARDRLLHEPRRPRSKAPPRKSRSRPPDARHGQSPARLFGCD